MNTSAYLDGYMHKTAEAQTLSYGDEIDDEIDDEIREEGASPRRRKKKPAKKTNYIPVLASTYLLLSALPLMAYWAKRAAGGYNPTDEPQSKDK